MEFGNAFSELNDPIDQKERFEKQVAAKLAEDPNCSAEVDYDYILKNHLSAIDTCAASFAMDNHMKLHIFGLDDSENIYRVIMGEKIGTIVD